MCACKSNSNSLYTDIAYAYWNDICDADPLPLDEQKRLFQLIKSGDTVARDTLVESFLRLVISRAKLYCHDFDSFMDMVQEGNIGLLRAVEKFDPDKGYFFSTYATQWIDKYIRKESRRTGMALNVSDYARPMINRMITAEKVFMQENGREPDVYELAKILDMDPKQVAELQQVVKPALSLDEDFSDTPYETKSLMKSVADTDALSPEDVVMAKDTKRFLANVMKENLTDIEYKVIRLRFGFTESGDTATLRQISETYGITMEGIRKIEIRAIQKLQKAILKTGLLFVDLI